jgi:thioredoxin-dependent peroxiredoxin
MLRSALLADTAALSDDGASPNRVRRMRRTDRREQAMPAQQEKTFMRRSLITAVATAVIAVPAFAALPDGTKAPDFSTDATLAGKAFKFSLQDALKKGPVVLYFYPAAFTPGCTVEAHEFAEATDKFKALGATVIGVSHDPIEKLNKFSVSECRNKFAVASDADGSVMKNYDAILPAKPEYANRTSYVIAPTGVIIYSYTDLKPDKHVENTMAAVKKWQDEHKKV